MMRQALPAWADDPGEVAGQAYRLQHPLCNEVPRFGTEPTAIDAASGDPERDTYALPVIGADLICANRSGASAH